jgi:hypothetical protein
MDHLAHAAGIVDLARLVRVDQRGGVPRVKLGLDQYAIVFGTCRDPFADACARVVIEQVPVAHLTILPIFFLTPRCATAAGNDVAVALNILAVDFARPVEDAAVADVEIARGALENDLGRLCCWFGAHIGFLLGKAGGTGAPPGLIR